jgi:hypothetical protein
MEAAVMKGYRLQISIALLLIAAAVSLRLLPHPANFAPVAAVAIFGGAVLPRKLAVWVPLAAMVVSDLFIGFYDTMFVTWACYLVIALAASRWLQKPTLFRGAALTLSSSVFFFVVTNFAVWVWSGMYAHSWNGLVNCYAMALPFFRNTLMSDLCYTALLFGISTFAVAAVLKHSLNTVVQETR